MRKHGMVSWGRRLAFGALGACALLVAVAGCGLIPGGPPTAQEIFDRARQSKMKDAAVTLSGALATSISGININLTINGNGQIVTKPAAYHLTLNAALSSAQVNGTITVDLIQVGDTVYSKTAIQIPGFPTTNSDLYTKATAPADQGSLLPQSSANLKLVGEETIRGDKCWHITSTQYVDAQGTPVPTTTAGASPVTTDMWIRESDYYYVRVKLDSLPGLSLPLGGTSASASSNGFTVDLSDFDKGVTISPPPADQIQP